MRPIIITFLICISCISAFSAEKPEPVPLKTKMIRSQAWYAEQATAWEQELEKNSTEEGWVHFYTASRYAMAHAIVLDQIERDALTRHPLAWSTHLISGWNHLYEEDPSGAIDRAAAQQPAHVTVNALQALRAEYQLSPEARTNALRALWQNNGISPSLFHYCYNVLMSLEPDAILFTEGDNTTLPILLLQDVFHVREDVGVLNLELLTEDSYRQRKLTLLDLKMPSQKTPSPELKQWLCTALPSENPTRHFYYSLTIGQQNIGSIKDQLYVVGLASQMSEARIDNLSRIRENLEKKFLLDNLVVDFNGESSFGSGKVLSTNYLLPMLLLTEEYRRVGDTENAARWEKLVNRVAEQTGRTVLVKTFLSGEKVLPFVSANLDIKAVETNFRQVKGNIYALDNEVTNADYNFFLRFLTSNNRKDEYEKYKHDLSRYTEPALSFMRSYHIDVLPNKKSRQYTAYPVVNVSYEGARAYCQWLTEQYNNTPGRKYKKVVFRLPSVKEWRIAALGYKKFQSWDIEENQIEMSIPKTSKEEICKGCPLQTFSFPESGILYPWFGAYNIRNSPVNIRGCGMGNFKYPENAKGCRQEMPTPDGWMLMAPVESYFANDMGLFDVVGNVAEMTAEEGKACGGSWNHAPEESTITSINTYSGPGDSIGFRPFMEVIEQ